MIWIWLKKTSHASTVVKKISIFNVPALRPMPKHFTSLFLELRPVCFTLLWMYYTGYGIPIRNLQEFYPHLLPVMNYKFSYYIKTLCWIKEDNSWKFMIAWIYDDQNFLKIVSFNVQNFALNKCKLDCFFTKLHPWTN